MRIARRGLPSDDGPRTGAQPAAVRRGRHGGSDAEPPLTRASGVALHRQVFMVLRDRIARGDWRAGDALPTEEALCERFGVSRITARRALSDLQAQGLVERRHGLGTFVSSRVPEPMPRATLSFVDGLRRHAQQTEVSVLEVVRARPPADIAALLALAPGERALHAVRCRSARGAPVMITDAWVPARLARGITAAALRRRALYEILMDQGVRFGRVVQEIRATAADPGQASLLGTGVGAPLLQVLRLIHDEDDRPVQHLNATMPAERGSVLMEITGRQIDSLSAGFIVHTR